MENYYPEVIFYTTNDIGVIFNITNNILKSLQKINSFEIVIENNNSQPLPTIRIADKFSIPLSLIDIDFLGKNDDSSIVIFTKTVDNIVAQPILQIKADKTFILECKAIEKALKMKIN